MIAEINCIDTLEMMVEHAKISSIGNVHSESFYSKVLSFTIHDAAIRYSQTESLTSSNLPAPEKVLWQS